MFRNARISPAAASSTRLSNPQTELRAMRDTNRQVSFNEQSTHSVTKQYFQTKSRLDVTMKNTSSSTKHMTKLNINSFSEPRNRSFASELNRQFNQEGMNKVNTRYVGSVNSTPTLFARSASSLNAKSTNKIAQDIIIVVGGPGSGKGTHCKLLAEHKRYHHISAGDLIRSMLNSVEGKDNPLAEKLREKMRIGELVDDQFVIDLIKKEMADHPEAAGFLIDGSPRTIEQLSMFENQIGKCSKVIHFDTDENTLVQRIIGRSAVEHREDDNEKTAIKRINVYKEKTIPVITKLRQQYGYDFIYVDTSGIAADVNRKLESLLDMRRDEIAESLSSLKLGS